MRLQKESDLKKESEKNKTSENRNKKLKKTEKNERKIKRIDSAIERKVEKKINFYAKTSEIIKKKNDVFKSTNDCTFVQISIFKH